MEVGKDFTKVFNTIKRSTKIGGSTKLVLSTIIGFDKNSNVNKIHLSDRYLAEEHGMTSKTIFNIRKELRELGLIKEIHSKDSNGKDLATEFQVEREKINEFFGDNIYGSPKPKETKNNNNQQRQFTIPELNLNRKRN